MLVLFLAIMSRICKRIREWTYRARVNFVTLKVALLLILAHWSMTTFPGKELPPALILKSWTKVLNSSIWALIQGSLQVKPAFKITPCFFIPVLSAVKFTVSCQPLSYIPAMFFAFISWSKEFGSAIVYFLVQRERQNCQKRKKHYRLGINQE